MSIDRIATAQQSQYFLSQIENASGALNTTQQQIASGDNSTTYAGFGTQTQVLQATMSANSRNSAYQTATSLAVTQADIQDTQLTSLSSLATQLNSAVSTAISTNDPSTLMSQVQSIFNQAVSVLNSQDANGAYIYGGGNDSTPPVSTNSLSQLASLPSASNAFTNGNNLKSVQVADGQTVTYGVTASSVAGGLMQELQNIAQFDQGANGNFSGSANVTSAQNGFLTGEITATSTVASNLNNATAQNGDNFSALTNAQTQQSTMATLYTGFISNIQDTNMAQAATQLSLDQTQLQAALQVTSTLNNLTLLNFLPPASSVG
jgi:flagellar hook-associated protein 3 FlgL